MTEKNENTQPQLSADSRSLFEDIRSTLSGRPEQKGPLPAGSVPSGEPAESSRTEPEQVPVPAPLRVGLLVWAGVLAILALLIILQLFLTVSSGPVILGILMAVFGAILVGVGVSSGSRTRTNRG